MLPEILITEGSPLGRFFVGVKSRSESKEKLFVVSFLLASSITLFSKYVLPLLLWTSLKRELWDVLYCFFPESTKKGKLSEFLLIKCFSWFLKPGSFIRLEN